MGEGAVCFPVSIRQIISVSTDIRLQLLSSLPKVKKGWICLKYVPWRPRLSFQNQFKTKQALGEASAVISADLSVTTLTAGGEEPEEPFLPCSFGPLMCCNRLGLCSPALKKGARPVGLLREERAAPRSLIVLIVTSIPYILFSSSYLHIL